MMLDPMYAAAAASCTGEYAWILPFLAYRFHQSHPQNDLLAATQKLVEMTEGKNAFLISECFHALPVSCGFKENKTVFPCGNSLYLQPEQDAQTPPIPLQDCEAFLELMRQLTDLLNAQISVADVKRPMAGDQPLVFNRMIRRQQGLRYNESVYLPQWQFYQKWLEGTLNRSLLMLELGVGVEFPTVIRFPFEKVTLINQKARLVRVHEQLYQLTEDVSKICGDRAVSVPQNSVSWVLNA